MSLTDNSITNIDNKPHVNIIDKSVDCLSNDCVIDNDQLSGELINRWQRVLTEIRALEIKSNQLGFCEESTKSMSTSNTLVTLLAVSKTKPSEMIAQLAMEGQIDFGENYLQEALGKIKVLKEYSNINWHYIGSIQRNKTRDIAQNFDWVHTIEREVIAKRLNEQRPDHLDKLNILIQINIDIEASKSGCLPTELDMLIIDIKQYTKLELRGLMVIPSKVSEDAFSRTKLLFDEMAVKHTDLKCWDTLSMGMSGDMDEAIANGSTMVRVGTAIFGSRV